MCNRLVEITLRNSHMWAKISLSGIWRQYYFTLFLMSPGGSGGNWPALGLFAAPQYECILCLSTYMAVFPQSWRVRPIADGNTAGFPLLPENRTNLEKMHLAVESEKCSPPVSSILRRASAGAMRTSRGDLTITAFLNMISYYCRY